MASKGDLGNKVPCVPEIVAGRRVVLDPGLPGVMLVCCDEQDFARVLVGMTERRDTSRSRCG
jgi:hypothetical protein